MKNILYIFLFVISVFFMPITFCCTGIRIIAKDGSIIYARTLEYGQDIKSNIIFVPSGHKFTAVTPFKNKKGVQWKSRYSAVGTNALNMVAFVDGINEMGLAGGLFYFPDYAKYQSISHYEASYSLASWELLTWILTTCATINEIKQKLPKIKVSNAIFHAFGFILPIHVIVHDLSGKSLVIEYTHGKLHLYDNPIGVITNSPNFKWHITNLRNYVNLSAINVPKIKLSGLELLSFGQGSGMLGLPGDFTPPSRFVRATAFSQSVNLPNSASEALHTAFHILNLFDIPKGIIRDYQNKKLSFDYTQWTTAADLENRKYYFHTYDNRQLCMVDLHELNKTADKLICISMKAKENIRNLTHDKSVRRQI